MEQITLTAQESASFVEIDPGAYPARVTDIIPEEGQYGPQLKFVFTLAGMQKDDGSPVEMWGWCSQKLTPQSKLWKWSNAMGVPPSLGQNYSTSGYLNREVQVLVNLVDTEGGPRPRIVDILPAKKKGAPAVAESAEVCCVPKCDGEVAKYDDEGNAFCQKHAA